MKSIFLIGGLLGYSLVLLGGLSAGREPALVMRDAAFGCLAGALLVRWFWRVLLRAVGETARRRREEATPPDVGESIPASRPASSR